MGQRPENMSATCLAPPAAVHSDVLLNHKWERTGKWLPCLALHGCNCCLLSAKLDPIFFKCKYKTTTLNATLKNTLSLINSKCDYSVCVFFFSLTINPICEERFVPADCLATNLIPNFFCLPCYLKEPSSDLWFLRVFLSRESML